MYVRRLLVYQPRDVDPLLGFLRTSLFYILLELKSVAQTINDPSFRACRWRCVSGGMGEEGLLPVRFLSSTPSAEDGISSESEVNRSTCLSFLLPPLTT
jgi:hypothetical protein